MKLRQEPIVFAASVVLLGGMGYRLFTAGALLVPEPAARCWHQGSSAIRNGAPGYRTGPVVG